MSSSISFDAVSLCLALGNTISLCLTDSHHSPSHSVKAADDIKNLKWRVKVSTKVVIMNRFVEITIKSLSVKIMKKHSVANIRLRKMLLK